MEKNMREQTCCFTGHRDIAQDEKQEVKRQLERELRSLIGKGIRYFGSGGARGVDLIAADVVLQLKKEFPHIRLIMVLPCRHQTRGWRGENIRHYESILSQADKVVYIQEKYSPDCMQKRNRHLVDHSSVCVAYCTRNTGGTAYTLRYACKKSERIVLLNRDNLLFSKD